MLFSQQFGDTSQHIFRNLRITHYLYTLNLLNPKSYFIKIPKAMDAQINHRSTEEEIQVYRNDFFSGIVMLTRKLFMF